MAKLRLWIYILREYAVIDECSGKGRERAARYVCAILKRVKERKEKGLDDACAECESIKNVILHLIRRSHASYKSP